MLASGVIRLASGLDRLPDLANRGVLDTLGLAVPMIALTRNDAERREVTVDRGLVIGTAFFLAPLHAWLFKTFLSRLHGIEPALLGLAHKTRDANGNWRTQNYRNNGEALRQGIQHRIEDLNYQATQKGRPSSIKIQKEVTQLRQYLKHSPKEMTGILKKLNHAKFWMLSLDLLVECLIFGNIGFITNWVNRQVSGDNTFTGEKGVADTKTLEALSKKENFFGNLSEKSRQWITTGLSAVLAFGVAGALHKASVAENLGKLGQWLKKEAYRFDYKDGLWMAVPALGVVVIAQEIGALLSARSKREFQESLIRETAINVLFFVMNTWWAMGLAKGLRKLFNNPNVQSSMKALLPKTSKQTKLLSALSYLGGFGITTSALASIIVYNNKRTHHNLENDLVEFRAKQLLSKQPLV